MVSSRLSGETASDLPSKMKDIEISELFGRLVAEAAKHEHEGWRPVGGEVAKLGPDRDPDFIRNVRNYYRGGFGLDVRDYFPGASSTAEVIARTQQGEIETFRGQVIEADGLESMFLRMRTYVERFHPRYVPLFENLCADPLETEGPRGYIEPLRDAGGPVPTSWAAVGIAHRLIAMIEQLEKYKPYHQVGAEGRFIEIGGGFGQLLGTLARVHRKGRMVCVDLPANLAATYFHLQKLFPRQVGRFWFDGDEIDDSHRLLTVAPWKLHELPAEDTIAINFRSFQHMDRANHDFYSQALKGVGCRAIYHVNRDYIRDPGDLLLDQYPYRDWCQLMSRCLGPFESNVVVHDGQATELSLYEELLVRR